MGEEKQSLREYLETLLENEAKQEDSAEQYVIKGLGENLSKSREGLLLRCMARGMSMSRISGLENEFVIRPLKEEQDLDKPINISGSVSHFYEVQGYIVKKERRHSCAENLLLEKKGESKGFFILHVDPVGGLAEPGIPWELWVSKKVYD